MTFLRNATPGADVDRFSYGTAPELVVNRRLGWTDEVATKASDVYAFGVLMWEVSAQFSSGPYSPLNKGLIIRHSRVKPHSRINQRSQGLSPCGRDVGRLAPVIPNFLDVFGGRFKSPGGPTLPNGLRSPRWFSEWKSP